MIQVNSNEGAIEWAKRCPASDNKVITASGLGSIEFAREIIKQLEIYDEADTKIWFEMFKHGIFPK